MFKTAILTIFLLTLVQATTAADLSIAHGGGLDALPADQMSDAKRAAIQAQIDANLQVLRAQGKLPATRGETVTFGWPIQAAAGLGDPGVHGISNFVDQNPSFPNQLLDYNCGSRTYDLSGGYNHRGIDFFTWPYGWKRMDDDAVNIVAVAPGTILLKSDGNYDRSCGFNNNNWNAVYVVHADDSIVWYGHMKNGSLTSKLVGETVDAGEILGVIGSSGSSTGPHLHMETYDGTGQLIEPYTGACNSLNTNSWWASQRDYYDSAINRLETAPAPPVFPACPTAEPNFSRRVFAISESIHVIAFYHDQLISQTSDYSLLRPNGTVYNNWQHNSNAAHYSASYWYWIFNLAGQPTGTWRWRVVFEGQTYEREFELVLNGDSDADGVSDHLDNCMDAANATQSDSNGDGYGNACDPDLNNDGSVNFQDLNILKSAFFTTPASPTWNPDADFNDDNVINFSELQIIKDLFFGVPGPSAYVP